MPKKQPSRKKTSASKATKPLIQSIVVLGVGVVGNLVSRMLSETCKVTAVDQGENPGLPKSVRYVRGDVSNRAFLEKLLSEHDAVVSCLPYFLTESVALAAHKTGTHYFDPTEDVKATQIIRALAETSKAVMIPQNGLAPGLIGILGAYLAAQCESLRNIRLRVGALPQNPIGQLGYAGNWSLEGLVNEYIQPCDVVTEGRRQQVPALRYPEVLRILGMEYEAFTTSGGLGTMTETYERKVEELNYKSIRYPGHLQGMRLLIEELRFKEEPQQLVRWLRNALPPDPHDRVLIHASVQGVIKGKMQTRDIVADYVPIEWGGKTWTAIAWTTAASIVAVVEMVRTGALPKRGFVKQEDIPLKAFLKTPTGSLFATYNKNLRSLA